MKKHLQMIPKVFHYDKRRLHGEDMETSVVEPTRTRKKFV